MNLNYSRKPEYALQERLIEENINMYGLQCKFLYSTKINEDNLVFNDFSGFKVEDGFEDLIVMPEDSADWLGDQVYNGFGFYNQQVQNGIISKATVLKLFPDFYEGSNKRTELINSLIITPASQVLEITDMTEYNIGVNNLWAYKDQPSAYKITLKIHANNLADEGVSDISGNIDIGDENFEYEEPVSTTEIDEFFNSLEVVKTEQDTEGDKISNTGGVFGNLS